MASTTLPVSHVFQKQSRCWCCECFCYVVAFWVVCLNLQRTCCQIKLLRRRIGSFSLPVMPDRCLLNPQSLYGFLGHKGQGNKRFTALPSGNSVFTCEHNESWVIPWGKVCRDANRQKVAIKGSRCALSQLTVCHWDGPVPSQTWREHATRSLSLWGWKFKDWAWIWQRAHKKGHRRWFDKPIKFLTSSLAK